MVKVRAPELYTPRMWINIRKHRKAVTEAVGIDPAIVAAQLGIKPNTVLMIQRKLGLRKCTGHIKNGRCR